MKEEEDRLSKEEAAGEGEGGDNELEKEDVINNDSSSDDEEDTKLGWDRVGELLCLGLKCHCFKGASVLNLMDLAMNLLCAGSVFMKVVYSSYAKIAV